MIHDIICSWCPIGYRNIKFALAEFESQLEVEFRFLPYELNPEMPAEGERIDVHLKRRNDWNDEQFLRYRDDLVNRAGRAGLDYDFGKRTHYWNTASAHKLLHLAEKFDKQLEMNEALIAQYFTNGVDVSDTENLVAIAATVGVDRELVLSALSSPQVAEQMAAKYARVQGFDLQSVPTLVVNNSDVLRGSNSIEFFVNYIADYLSNVAA